MSLSLFAVVTLGLAIAAISFYFQWLYRQRAPWHPDAKLTEKFAEIVNLPRKPGENLSDWDARVLAQHAELMGATDDFFAAVRRGDGTEEKVGDYGLLSTLPVDHPAAIRYARAKNGLPRA